MPRSRRLKRSSRRSRSVGKPRQSRKSSKATYRSSGTNAQMLEDFSDITISEQKDFYDVAFLWFSLMMYVYGNEHIPRVVFDARFRQRDNQKLKLPKKDMLNMLDQLPTKTTDRMTFNEKHTERYSYFEPVIIELNRLAHYLEFGALDKAKMQGIVANALHFLRRHLSQETAEQIVEQNSKPKSSEIQNLQKRFPQHSEAQICCVLAETLLKLTAKNED